VSLDTRFDGLEKANERLEKENRSIKEDLKELIKAYKSTKEDLRELGKGNEKLEKANERLEKANERLEKANKSTQENLRELGKVNERLEKANERLEKANERLEKENKSTKEDLKKLGKADENLKADIIRMRQSQERLEAQNEKQEEEIQGLRRDLVKEKDLRDEISDSLRQLTVMIIPLHLRVLLDTTRQQILRDMKVESWEDLRGERNAYDLAHWLHSTLPQQSAIAHLPSLGTFTFLCLYNNVRREGNLAAHSATPTQIKEAVQTKPLDSTDRKCLREMFIYAFKDSDI